MKQDYRNMHAILQDKYDNTPNPEDIEWKKLIRNDDDTDFIWVEDEEANKSWQKGLTNRNS